MRVLLGNIGHFETRAGRFKTPLRLVLKRYQQTAIQAARFQGST
jgi:hypothetical protein